MAKKTNVGKRGRRRKGESSYLLIFHFFVEGRGPGRNEMHSIRFRATSKRMARNQSAALISRFFSVEGIVPSGITRGKIHLLASEEEIDINIDSPVAKGVLGSDEKYPAPSGEQEGTWL